MSEEANGLCNICGEPMPPGEEMFKFHGYNDPCPKPPLPKCNHRPTYKIDHILGVQVVLICRHCNKPLKEPTYEVK